MAQAVLWEVVDGIGRLELNRPESLNALSFDMMEALDAASAALVQRPDLRVLVVSGRGGHFMAGGDIRDFSRLLDRTPGERRETFRTAIEQRVNPVVERLSRVPCPVVAKVSGACAGFGMSLMLACDLAIAWTFFDGESREVFRDGMAHDHGAWARGRGWTLWKALIVLAGMAGAPASEKAKQRVVIDEVLADHRRYG